MGGYGTYLSALRSEDENALVIGKITGLYKLVWQVFILSVPFSAFFHRYLGSRLTRAVIYNFLTLECSFNEEWWFILPYAVMLALFPLIKRLVDRKNATFAGSVLLIIVYSLFYNYFFSQMIKYPFFDTFRESVFRHRLKEI